MQFPTLPKLGRLSKVHSFAVAGTATAALTVLAITAGVQGSDGTALASANEPSTFASVSTADPQTIADQAGAAAKHAAADAAAKKKAADKAAAAKKKAADAAAKKKAADEAAQRKEEQAANRSKERKALAAKEKAETKAPAPAPAAVTYTNDLDGWIKESLSVMAAHNIPGTYDGIYRNIIRESSGNPQAINLTDSNAMAGIPSKGLLQVIDPTFQQYHVEGTSMDIYDPVANITAACNYAAANYGTIDNVDSAY
ncbi:transglycosylase SLT domain-containing protein [Streptomyces sp. H39-S7]|uniref:transglycosylase SLT domain-containing protein n=1 Tax=Streptomyces sp. H39-S7 TaxID=3004357 RepID=UPI0022AE7C1C|nr:transglycosylase SLT domain-containing protein [Streptomyces sp. H39-S7]MCZ4125110.1 transglycosylase SLT domain-containing protein [Streptomyces sp. H39-S7]